MDAQDLALWQQRSGLRSQKAAAEVLGLSLASYRRKLAGGSKVDRRTELLCGHHDLVQALEVGRLVALSDLTNKLLRLTARRP